MAATSNNKLMGGTNETRHMVRCNYSFGVLVWVLRCSYRDSPIHAYPDNDN